MAAAWASVLGREVEELGANVRFPGAEWVAWKVILGEARSYVRYFRTSKGLEVV